MYEIELLREFANIFVSLDQRINDCISPVYNYHRVAASIHDLCAQISVCEKKYQRTEILEILKEARAIHRRSPLIQRLQDWPKGYAGDYETIEYLLNSINYAPANTVEYYCEQYALNCSAAQQHRNKMQYQALLILAQFLNSQPKILSIACNSCQDMRLIQTYLAKLTGEIVLYDSDPDALAYAQSQLKSIEHICQYVNGNPIKFINNIAKTGEFDLVVAGGFFDYLHDKHVKYFIKEIYNKVLKPGGKLFFTNVAKGNPYRLWFEYLSNWIIKERSEQEVITICEELGINVEKVKISREETGLTLMVELLKP